MSNGQSAITPDIPIWMSRRSRVILFDGVCNLCNAWVTFVIDRDPAQDFAFAALQDLSADEMHSLQGAVPLDLSSIILIEGNRVYDRSTAVLHIARRLRGAWKLAAIFELIPRRIRDAAYAFVARHRYRWFGRTDSCRLPTPDLQSRFLARTRI